MSHVNQVVDIHQKRDFLSFDDTLRHREIQVDRHNNIIKVYEEEGKMKHVIVGKSINITDINKNIESEEISYNIEINTFDGRRLLVEGLKRKDLLDRNELLALTALGAEVNSNNAKYYIRNFENQERELAKNLKNTHENVGWIEVGGKDIFIHEEALGVESEYQGELDIQTKGTLEDWLKFLEENILGHVALETCIAIGLSAVVVGFIGDLIGVNSQLFHIYGNSSTGKTTAGELIISTAAKPSISTKGLMNTWSATVNALIGNIRNNGGLPILFDDSSVARIKDFSEILYMLVQGRDKDRMDKEANLREAKTWRTTMVSTGEQSLVNNSNQNDGIRARVFELGNVEFTKDAEHSERIKRGVQENYGHGVIVVAKELLKLDKSEVVGKIEEIRSECLQDLEDQGREHPLYPRMLNSIATVILAIGLFENHTNLGFNLEAIRAFLLDNILIDERTIGIKAYEDLLEHVTANRNKFYRNIYIFDTEYLKSDEKIEGLSKSYRPANTNTDILGKIDDISYEIVDKEIQDGSDETSVTEKTIKISREISILRNKFDDLLNNMGYHNPAGVLKELKEKGLISHDSDRYTRKRKLTEEDSVSTVVVLKTIEEYEKLK